MKKSYALLFEYDPQCPTKRTLLNQLVELAKSFDDTSLRVWGAAGDTREAALLRVSHASGLSKVELDDRYVSFNDLRTVLRVSPTLAAYRVRDILKQVDNNGPLIRWKCLECVSKCVKGGVGLKSSRQGFDHHVVRSWRWKVADLVGLIPENMNDLDSGASDSLRIIQRVLKDEYSFHDAPYSLHNLIGTHEIHETLLQQGLKERVDKVARVILYAIIGRLWQHVKVYCTLCYEQMGVCRCPERGKQAANNAGWEYECLGNARTAINDGRWLVCKKSLQQLDPAVLTLLQPPMRSDTKLKVLNFLSALVEQ